MSDRGLRWRGPLCLLVAAAAVGAGSFLAAGVAAPQSWPGAASPLAWVQDERAQRALATRPGALGVAEATAASWAALRLSPVDDVAWLRLAYLNQGRQGGLTDEGQGLLRRSYDVAPYGPDITVPRLSLVFENWPRLSPELRKSALDEVEAAWWSKRPQLQVLPQKISNPIGRLAASLAIERTRGRIEAGLR